MKRENSLERLRKILRLERQRGFDDRAVMGGLERLAPIWAEQARQEGVDEALIARVIEALQGYAGLDVDARRERLDALLHALSSQASPGTGAPRTGARGATMETAPRPAPVPRPTPAVAKSEVVAPPRPSPPPRPAPPGGVIPGVPHRAGALAPPWIKMHPALTANVIHAPGVGPKTARRLARLGVETMADLLYLFPREYHDYTHAEGIRFLRRYYGRRVIVLGQVKEVIQRQPRPDLTLIQVWIDDGTGRVQAIWFNQTWILDRLKPGALVALYGVVDQHLGMPILRNPEFEIVRTQNLVKDTLRPIYPLTQGLYQSTLRNIMERVLPSWAPRVPDPLPDWVRREARLPKLGWALRQMHKPDNLSTLEQARRRLAFDEVFFLQLGLQRIRQQTRQAHARTFPVDDAWLQAQLDALPFELTGAQRRALEAIRADLTSGRPMNRLLQGDVGAGKTVVAALAMAMVVHHGAQAALMAPTGILAEQHYRNLQRLLVHERGVVQPEEIALLTGATPQRERRALLEALAEGRIKILVGTHALIEEPVQFADLQLAVIDEQHRFGVRQRAALRAKGNNPHVLVMTATPIPRSLALTLYGDLDLTVLDEMPPGRKPVQTYILYPSERERAYAFIRREVARGHQAFILYPFIEPSESEALQHVPAVLEAYPRLRDDIFPDLKVGLLHGQMKPEEKDEVMRRFREGEYHILAATPVIEVGVDIPNATVMLIEGADRFGLAQLHQLRGRVGRGGQQAHCILIPSKADAAENQRLQALTQIHDGFRLAELDLRQRGPGEFLGTRQSGYQVASFRLASLMDLPLIEHARTLAQRVLARDPDLQAREHQTLAQALEAALRERAEVS